MYEVIRCNYGNMYIYDFGIYIINIKLNIVNFIILN